jgi:hypothetical protein
LISCGYCVLLRLLSSHLALFVLTFNQVFVALSSSFTGSPIHPPLGALTYAYLGVSTILSTFK